MRLPFQIVVKTLLVLYGAQRFLRVRWRYGKKTFIFLCRGKTGDIFLYFRFLPAFLKQHHIEKFVLIGDCKGMKNIQKLYPEIQADCIPLSSIAGRAMQEAYCFLEMDRRNCALSLMWDQALLFNRCMVRMTMPFNFIDSYYWFLFDLDRERSRPTHATFASMTVELKEKLDKMGVVPGRTVILSPVAYCVKTMEPLFWRLIGRDLEARGYRVFVMLSEDEENEYGFPRIFFPYRDSAAVLQYAGHFIGLRSGFCDIISEIPCNQVILYPKKKKKLEYDHHRADFQYSSMKIMELATDSIEIEVPFAQDISNVEPLNENFEESLREKRVVADAVLKKFPILGEEVLSL